MKVSVIIPAWGVEDYLPACLDSVLSQEGPALEILAVDDGSPDRCGEIIDSTADRDRRVIALHKENGGLSSARNFGLARATGEAIFFLDGDDLLLPGTLSEMANAMEENGADLVLCDALSFWETGKEKRISSGAQGSLSGTALKAALTRLYPVAWNKLYRRDLLDSLFFREGVWFEDVEFFHRFFPRVNSLVALDFSGVKYRQRAGSITAAPSPRLFDYLTVMDSIVAWYRANGLLPDWEKELEYCCARYLLATFCKRAARLPDGLDKKAAAKSLTFLNEKLPHWRDNPYFSGPKGWYLKHFSARFLPILRSIT